MSGMESSPDSMSSYTTMSSAEQAGHAAVRRH